MHTNAFVFAITLTVATVAPVASAQVQSDSTYAVQAGDTLFSIAKQFGVSVRALKTWNRLDTSTLHEGQVLRIRPPQEGDAPADTTTPSKPRPTPPEAPDSTAPDSIPTPPQPYGHHAVERGDTFVNLALRLGTTADSLFSLNERMTGALLPGQTLRLPRRFGPPTHVVNQGETLYQIAGEYGVSVRALQAANELDTTAISPGQRLRLPTAAGPTVSSPGDWAGADSTGAAAVYPSTFAGRLTASGIPYEPDAFVVSHPSLPYGSVVLLSIPKANRHTFARVVDRGPLDQGVLVDVSEAVADELGFGRDEKPLVALRTVWVHRPGK